MNNTCPTTNPTGPARAFATDDTYYPFKYTCEYFLDPRAAGCRQRRVPGLGGRLRVRERERVCVGWKAVIGKRASAWAVVPR